jgi:hypothetical protein
MTPVSAHAPGVAAGTDLSALDHRAVEALHR